MKRAHSFAFSVLMLGACATPKGRAHREEMVAHYERELRPGMSKDELRAINPRLGNCSGSPASFEKCEWIIPTESAERGFRIAETESETLKTSSRFRGVELPVFELSFDRDRLQHWKRLAPQSEKKP